MDTGHSADDSQQSRKRKRKRSSQKVDGKTSAASLDGHKQLHKIGRKQRRNVHKDSEQSVKSHKHSVTVAASLSKKKLGAKKVRHK